MSKNLKELNSGFCSNAYILDNDYIQLIGKREDSFNVYQEIKNKVDLLEDKIKCVKYPRNMTLIEPNKEYPYGSLIYPMIKGNPLNAESATVDELKKIAKKIIEFNFEMHNSDIHWDRKSSIYNANKKIEKSLLLLQEYLKIDEINSLQEFSIKFNTYLNSKQHFCITHGDLWAENLIVNQKNELIGIIDFESMTYFLPEVDYASFWNMKDGFLDLLLEYSNEDVTIESVALFVLYREVSSFPYIMHDGEEEIECQIQKIRDALKFNESKKKKNKMI